jgi:hypothetical protein
MKLRLLILLAAALAASPAAGQTIKSLGFNTTNGNIVAATNVTFTNSVGFATNARAATRTNLGGTTVGDSVFTATNAAAAATAIGLGTANDVTFNRVQVGGSSFTADDFSGGNFVVTGGRALTFSSGGTPGATLTNLGLGTTNAVTFGTLTAEQLQVRVGTNLYVGLADDVSEFWTDVAVNETLSVSGSATFATNVTVNGNLSVGSLTTTTPSTWALDATETAAATNGILALPSNANVIRLTNNTAISGVSGGVLGAFYYLVNQTTNAVTISNVGGITVQGGTPLTLGANQAATLVATGATNASVAARGDLTDVTLGGTLNTAPSQTADSGSSLMTRGLSDTRFYPLASFWLPAEDMQSYNAAGAGNPTWTTTASIMNMVTPFGRSPRTVAAPDATGRSEGIYTIPAGWPAGAQVRVTTYLALFNSATTNVFNLVLGGYWTTNTNIISPVATAIGSVFGGSSTLTTNVAGTGTTNEYFKISNTFSFATNANVENRQVYVARFSTSTNDTATNTIYFIGSHVELLP